MKLLTALFVCLSTQAFACDLFFPTAQVCGMINWTRGPVLRTESSIDMLFVPHVAASTVKVEAWMPEHNHGTRPVTISWNSDGMITVSKLYFVMPGEWVLRVSIPVESTTGATTWETAELPVQL